MKCVIIDGQLTGASGDMFLGALLDLYFKDEKDVMKADKKRKELANKIAKIVVKYLVRDKILKANYDFIGLVFWLLNKFLQKLGIPAIHGKRDFYCSELTYDAFKKVNVKVAKKKHPSPKDIENYNKHWIVFSDISGSKFEI